MLKWWYFIYRYGLCTYEDRKAEEIVFAAELWKVTEIAVGMNYITKKEFSRSLVSKKK